MCDRLPGVHSTSRLSLLALFFLFSFLPSTHPPLVPNRRLHRVFYWTRIPLGGRRRPLLSPPVVSPSLIITYLKYGRPWPWRPSVAFYHLEPKKHECRDLGASLAAPGALAWQPEPPSLSLSLSLSVFLCRRSSIRTRSSPPLKMTLIISRSISVSVGTGRRRRRVPGDIAVRSRRENNSSTPDATCSRSSDEDFHIVVKLTRDGSDFRYESDYTRRSPDCHLCRGGRRRPPRLCCWVRRACCETENFEIIRINIELQEEEERNNPRTSSVSCVDVSVRHVLGKIHHLFASWVVERTCGGECLSGKCCCSQAGRRFNNVQWRDENVSIRREERGAQCILNVHKEREERGAQCILNVHKERGERCSVYPKRP